MPSPSVTFPCPFCGRRIGVTAEYLGKQVRCPHCKQVVLAPTSSPPAGTTGPPAPPPAPRPAPVIQVVSPPPAAGVPQPSPPPSSATEPELPVLNVPQRTEGADSILSESNESEDEVFGSHPGLRLHTLPPLEPQPPVVPLEQPDARTEPTIPDKPTPYAPAHTPPTPLPPPPPATHAAEMHTTELTQQPAGLAPVSLPTAPAPVLVQPDAPTPDAAAGNPFADFDAPAAAPNAPRAEQDVADEEEEVRPRKRKKRERDEEDELEERREKPTHAQYGRTPAKSGGATTILLVLVSVYALVATGLAVYGLFFKPTEQLDPGHPLSTIPDNFGEFDPATRKKVVHYKFPVDGELPAAQRAKLGETVVIGDLEVRPVEVVKRPLTVETQGRDGEKRRDHPGTALVLTLDIKNTSDDLTIFPMDPAFTRRAAPGDEPITRLVVSKQKVFAGGAIPWPAGERIKKRMEIQQANDYVPLKPGESREYVVFTDAQPQIIREVERASEPMQWRVQVRRGPIEFRGKEVPVTAVIGVEFTAADVKTPAG